MQVQPQNELLDGSDVDSAAGDAMALPRNHHAHCCYFTELVRSLPMSCYAVRLTAR